MIQNHFQNNVSENNKTIIRHQVNSAINATTNNFFNVSEDIVKEFKAIKESEKTKAIKEFKNSNAIVIAPADKGCAVVIINKIDYTNKIEDHLNDRTTYDVKTRDTANSLRTAIN